VLQEAKSKPDRLQDNVITDPRPIPSESKSQTGERTEQTEKTIEKPTEAVLNVLAHDDKSPTVKVFPEDKNDSNEKNPFRMVIAGMALVL
jgi:hypothetical protein